MAEIVKFKDKIRTVVFLEPKLWQKIDDEKWATRKEKSEIVEKILKEHYSGK